MTTGFVPGFAIRRFICRVRGGAFASGVFCFSKCARDEEGREKIVVLLTPFIVCDDHRVAAKSVQFVSLFFRRPVGTGTIPVELGHLKSLRMLNLSVNKLSGETIDV